MDLDQAAVNGQSQSNGTFPGAQRQDGPHPGPPPQTREGDIAPDTRADAPLPGPLERTGEVDCSAENSQGNLQTVADEPPIRVMALHAMLYCERLFYLEEVEEIRVADAAVYAGRRLHDDVTPLDDESPEHCRVDVASEKWGMLGVVDAVRRRDGVWVAYEHKRGRCRRGDDGAVLAWPSDRIQAIAYAVLLEETHGEPVPQARVRYHADNVTAFVSIDDAARDDLRQAIARARELRKTNPNGPRSIPMKMSAKSVRWQWSACPKKSDSRKLTTREPGGPILFESVPASGCEPTAPTIPKPLSEPTPNPLRCFLRIASARRCTSSRTRRSFRAAAIA